MKPIKGILFDKDGTILDYWKTWIPINREVALMAASGDRALADQLLRHGGHDPATDRVAPGSILAAASMDGIVDAFAEVLGNRAPKNLASETSRLFRDGGAKHAVVLDGVAEALATLKTRGFRLGVATNDTQDGLDASLGRHAGLLEMFEFRCGCDSGHGSKPGPGMGLAFCSATGLDPRETAIGNGRVRWLRRQDCGPQRHRYASGSGSARRHHARQRPRSPTASLVFVKRKIVVKQTAIQMI
jgi:phosphoglycolate phosphatase